jgi:hypothetical protein
MTQEETTRRRCVACGRFRSVETPGGVCWSCRASGIGQTAIPIETPTPQLAAVRARSGSSGSSSSKPKPPRGVVILRPSQLHPDASSPVMRAPVETSVRPAPPPISAYQSRDVEVRPIEEPMPRLQLDSDGWAVVAAWGLRVVLALAVGILVGIVIPFLLSR